MISIYIFVVHTCHSLWGISKTVLVLFQTHIYYAKIVENNLLFLPLNNDFYLKFEASSEYYVIINSASFIFFLFFFVWETFLHRIFLMRMPEFIFFSVINIFLYIKLHLFQIWSKQKKYNNNPYSALYCTLLLVAREFEEYEFENNSPIKMNGYNLRIRSYVERITETKRERKREREREREI